MKGQRKIAQVRLLYSLGAFVLLVALSFQLLVGSHLLRCGDLNDLDPITCVIEKESPGQNENGDKFECYQVLFHHTRNISVALHLNKEYSHIFGQASLPHTNLPRYILFQNQKLDCPV